MLLDGNPIPKCNSVVQKLLLECGGVFECSEWHLQQNIHVHDLG